MNPAQLKVALSALRLPTARLPEVLTVGRGQRFATVAHAIEDIIANCPAPTQIYSAIGGTVEATKGSDILTFTGLAELFNIGPDVITGPGIYPLVQPVWIDIDNENKFRLIESVVVDPFSGGASQVIMATGWNLASVSGKTFKLYTLPTYWVEIPPGNNVIGSDLSHAMVGKRANVAFLGRGRHASQLNFYADVAQQETAIGFPDAGLVQVRDLKCLYSGNGNRPWGADSSNESGIEEQFFGLSVALDNLIVETAEGTTEKPGIGLLCAKIYANHLHLRAHSEVCVFHADSIIANDILMESRTGLVTGTSDFSYSWFQKTKKHQLHNIRYFNPAGIAPLMFGCVGDVSAWSGIKEVFAENIRCGDLYCESVQTDAVDSFLLVDVRADTISVSNVSVIATGETGNIPGQAVITVGAAPSTYTNLNAIGAVDIALVAGVATPDANMGVVNRIAVAGNLTVAAPVNPGQGQRLTLSYAADATPGRQITYNAAFKSSAVPASTANGKATHSFTFDSGYWVQDGGALVWL